MMSSSQILSNEQTATAIKINQPVHMCERCHYSTSNVCNLNRHLSKKFICNPVHSRVSTDELRKKLSLQNPNRLKKYSVTNVVVASCIHCHKKYSNKYTLVRHIKAIHKEEYEKSLSKRDDKSIISADEIKEEEKHIDVVALGSEFIEMIEPRKMYDWMTDPRALMHFGILFTEIHFSKEHPENNNVRLTDPILGVYEIFDGIKWKTLPEEQAIHQMIYHSYQMLYEITRQVNIPEQNDVKKLDVSNEYIRAIRENIISDPSIRHLIHDKRNWQDSRITRETEEFTNKFLHLRAYSLDIKYYKRDKAYDDMFNFVVQHLRYVFFENQFNT